jgi:hypothetical protein
MPAKQNSHEADSLNVPKSQRKMVKRRYWEALEELSQSIPEEELDKMPLDSSINYRHYMYGHPKVAG